MGKLIYIHEDGTITELIIGEGLIVEGGTLKVIDSCVIKPVLDALKLDEMLIS